MTVTRRKVVQAGAAVTAAAAVPWRLGGAQADDLIRRTIPSSGEAIVALGVGTNRYGVARFGPRRARRCVNRWQRFMHCGGQLDRYVRGVWQLGNRPAAS